MMDSSVCSWLQLQVFHKFLDQVIVTIINFKTAVHLSSWIYYQRECMAKSYILNLLISSLLAFFSQRLHQAYPKGTIFTIWGRKSSSFGKFLRKTCFKYLILGNLWGKGAYFFSWSI